MGNRYGEEEFKLRLVVLLSWGDGEESWGGWDGWNLKGRVLERKELCKIRVLDICEGFFLGFVEYWVMYVLSIVS